MDRELAQQTIRATRLRRTATVALPIAALITAIALLPGWIRPSVARARIRTAVVRTGSMDATITASGTVAPEVERVLVSPIDARVLRLLKHRGAAVKTGDPLVELDVAESVLALNRVITDVSIADNQQAQARLALQRELSDLDGRIERKQLDHEMLAAKAANAARLFADGLFSQEALADARLAARQAEIELTQLRRERVNAEESTRLQAQGLSLQRTALERSEGEARRVLDLATTRADRDGVVTWMLPQEGVLVRKGEVIARIADLRSFRIDASVSDVHARNIRPGARVIVKAGDRDLPGSVAEVFPTVEDGIVRFTVSLAEASDPLLRPSLRVDVLVVVDHVARVLKLKQGPATDSGTGQAFVLQGDRARRVDVRLGIRDFDDVQIAGVDEGDEVIISDMRDYAHLKEIGIR